MSDIPNERDEPDRGVQVLAGGDPSQEYTVIRVPWRNIRQTRRRRPADPVPAAGQVPKPARTATAVRFPAELHERLQAAAVERDLSINYLVVRAVEEFLPRLIPADELRLTRDR